MFLFFYNEFFSTHHQIQKRRSMTSLTTTKTSTTAGPAPLFHLVPTQQWNQLSSGETYFPTTYANDGFTHLTADPALLLEVANHFYTDIPGDFVVLELDTRLLQADNAGQVKYEPAAPVGDKDTKPVYDGAQQDIPLFPHLYGGIPKGGRCVVGPPLAVTREVKTGKFLSIAYPIAHITNDIYVASAAAVADSGTMDTLVSNGSNNSDNTAAAAVTFASLRLTSVDDAPQRPLAFAPAMEHTVQLRDDDGLSTELPIIDCLGFIDQAVGAGHRVVVHSSHGVSRATSIVIAHLMFNNGTSLPETLSTVRTSGWSRAAPRPYFMSQLSELDQGDGHDPSVAARAVADIMSNNNSNDMLESTTLQEDEIESVIELNDDDVEPEDLEDEPLDDDDDAMRRAAEESTNNDVGLDPLPEEVYIETARVIYQQHTEAVCCLAASPVSTLVVSGGCDDHAILWDAATGATKFVLGDDPNVHRETVSVCG